MPENYGADINQGIWIDVFPLIFKAPTEKKFRKQVYCITKYQYYLANQMDIIRHHYSSFPQMVFCILREIFVFRPLTKLYYYKALLLSSKKSGLCFALGVSFFGKCDEKKIEKIRSNARKAELFENVKKYDFEKYSFYGVTDYDEYLSAEYGKDYMTPVKYSHFDDYSNVRIDD